MTRRTVIGVFAAAAVPVSADSASDAWDLIAGMAAALAEDNPPAFLKPIDPKMPTYGALADNVQAMVQQADAQSSISPLRNEGDDMSRTLELDWELRLTRKGEETRTQVREVAITVQFRKEEGKWRVAKIEPVTFFAPPNFR